MFLRVYHEDSKGCDAISIIEMEVETCSKRL